MIGSFLQTIRPVAAIAIAVCGWFFASGWSSAEQAPILIRDFHLTGEHWTCQAGGQPLSGVLIRPEGKGPFPAIVLSHGLGGNAQSIMTARGKELAKWGFVCIATDYTHAGKAEQGPPGAARGRFGGVDFTQAGARPENIRRAVACIEILRLQPDVDPARVAAYGHSMGAFVTIALAAAVPERLAAAAITAGGIATGQYRAGSAPSAEVAARVRTPFLILQGALDNTVPPASSLQFKQVLDDHQVRNTREVFEGSGHNLPVERAAEVSRLMRDWFAQRGLLPAEGTGAASEKLDLGRRTPDEWVTPAVAAPRLQFRSFQSAAVGAPVSYHLYTPAVYDSEPDRRFPVVYWLHGSGGGLPGIPQLAQLFDGAIGAGKIPPVLVVFANGLPNGMWCDSKDGKRPVETMVIKDLVPHIDSTFRTIASRQGRIIEGFSMGGYGAGRLGFKYPAMFCAISMLGAGPLQPELNVSPRVGARGREQILADAFGGDMAYFRAQSPWLLAEQHAAELRNGMPIRLAIGDQDETCPFNRDFHEHLVKLGIPHTFQILQGVGHKPLAVLEAMGETNWKFYRDAFATGANSSHQATGL